jgi:hypothetical protein
VLYGVVVPMLHGCSFQGCDTFTLSTYCFEHERLIRAGIEAERAQAAVRDEPITRELASLNDAAISQPEPPSV